MDSPSTVSLSGQIALRQQLDVVANNLANATTSGYRGDRTLFQSYVNRLAVPGREIAFVQDRATYIENRQGPIGSTGNPLDLALDPHLTLQLRPEKGERRPRVLGEDTTQRRPQLLGVDVFRILREESQRSPHLGHAHGVGRRRTFASEEAGQIVAFA